MRDILGKDLKDRLQDRFISIRVYTYVRTENILSPKLRDMFWEKSIKHSFYEVVGENLK